jgi:hypothetical protein
VNDESETLTDVDPNNGNAFSEDWRETYAYALGIEACICGFP